MYSILIVEDEKYARDYVGKYLTNNLGEYFNILTAISGEQAVEILKRNKINIVVTDIRMSGISGLELAKIINEEYDGIVVMITSGYEEFEYAKSAIRYNVREYFVKPFELEELKTAILKVKHELDRQKKNTFEDTRTIYEEREMFFVDLVYGSSKDIESVVEASKKLRFPFDIKNTPCDILSVRIDSYDDFLDNWSYTKESLKIAVSNIISGFLKSDYVFYIHSSDGYFEYIVYHTENTVPDYKSVSEKINDILKLPVTLKREKIFENLKQLLNSKDVSEVLEESVNISEPQSYSEPIERAKKYILENFHKNISREDVAKIVYLSPAYFTRTFKQYTGETFNDYLLRLRMEKAIELMKQNKYKIFEIAEKVGYENTKYFFRIFKMYTGYTPKDYIAKNMGRDDLK